MPGTDIGPAAIDRHHRGLGRLLHHRTIDRDRGRGGEGVLLQRDEAEIAARFGARVDHRAYTVGIDIALFFQQQSGRKHEVTAVPEIAGPNIVGRLGRIGLLDEFRDRDAGQGSGSIAT